MEGKKIKQAEYKKAGLDFVGFEPKTSESMIFWIDKLMNELPAIKKTGMTFREIIKAHNRTYNGDED